MMKKTIFSLLLIGVFLALQAEAQEIAQIKKLNGAVFLERGGKSMPTAVGMKLLVADTVKTC